MKYLSLVTALIAALACAGCGVDQATDSSFPADASPQSPPPAVQEQPAERDPQSEDKTVQADVNEMLDATYTGDADTLLGYTHPKIVEMLGGEAQAKATLETALANIQSSGMELESLEFPQAPTFLETDEHRFAIVPTLSVISVNELRAESLNYQFGVQEQGATDWKYIEGSRINQDNVRSLFPDFPADYKFPETYRRRL
jgi:hypothetical protein